jgi:hypothetical protein
MIHYRTKPIPNLRTRFTYQVINSFEEPQASLEESDCFIKLITWRYRPESILTKGRAVLKKWKGMEAQLCRFNLFWSTSCQSDTFLYIFLFPQGIERDQKCLEEMHFQKNLNSEE